MRVVDSPYPLRMESTKTSRGFLVAILLVTVVGLTALDIYQDHVIRRQQFELRWLMTHTVFKAELPVPASDGSKSAVPAAADKAPAASVAVVPQSSKPAAPAPSAKP